MATALKIIFTLLLIWQLIKPISILMGVGLADFVRKNTTKPATPADAARLNNMTTNAVIRIFFWITFTPLLVIATWVWL